MASARDDSPRKQLVDRGYIGLSFSGGGYRATAFSLGTMALLQDLGLLSKARVMSSVSGGSLALGGEELADAFLRLPLLLQGEKVILHAPDATQRFLSSLLGEEARLGNVAITDMLRRRTTSPDDVGFPGIGFYEDPRLDRKLENTPRVGVRSGSLSRRRIRRPLLPWERVVRTLLGWDCCRCWLRWSVGWCLECCWRQC